MLSSTPKIKFHISLCIFYIQITFTLPSIISGDKKFEFKHLHKAIYCLSP